MAGISSMTGTPWHIELFCKSKNDNRRHRAYCTYYNKKEKICRKYVEKCHGSAHCPFYKECHGKKQVSAAKTTKKNNVKKTDKPFLSSKETKTGKTQKTQNTCNPVSLVKDETCTLKQDFQSNLPVFMPGIYVLHERYGKGLISRVERNTIRIQFFHHGFETLDIDECRRNNLLKPELRSS